jgi:hypothetical protein
MSDTPSVPIAIRISNPERLLGIIWLVLGGLLLGAFFLPNFTMAGMNVNGPKLIEMLTRPDANIRRIFDDEGFFMMVTVPMLYTVLGVASAALGLLTIVQGKASGPVVLAVAALIVFVYAIVGAIMIHNSSSEMLIFTKLMPKPTVNYWLAMGLQFLIFVASTGYRLLRRPRAPIAAV